MAERLVVIGGVAAGMSAASRARRLNPKIEIMVFEKSGFVSYGSCGLPYFVSDVIKAPENLVVYDAKFFKEKRNIDVYLHHEVLKIFPAKRSVLVKDLERDKEFEIGYDKLVIATGARAVKPNIKGVDLKGIFTIRFLEDGIAIKNFIKENSPKRALIVGAGYIGMEMAEALVSLGIDVTVVEMMPNILGSMDDEINEIVEGELQRNGVKLLKSTSVVEFVGDGFVKGAILNNGVSLDVDLVIVGAGIKPNSEIARDAGIEMGRTGAIAVNQRMETNILGIFAAGDCAEAFHLVLGRPVYVPLGTTANKQGKVAGENAVGGNAVFKGIVGTAVFKVFDLEVARTGISEKQAREEGIDYVSTVIEHGSRAHYYPGGSKIRVKLIAERKTGRLLGAEMVGRDGVAKRIDVFATALHARMSIDELTQLDLSYAPPFAPVWDPILIAANDIEKKLKS
ncbi:NADPH-dependent 2,4-dienoyl-CoA reductase, sulfur reductase [Candidatus Thermokryptus mobilis]|uniref:NADPH-dependent 2,4-dienoyl-CoA reductase, sulfur reductase n=1 Tax=Candidatus Thermokryptus mobilis TaxID=1643428 RepID=A0A0S4MY36_9BACT|nr:CoA-disulfide reductase [Candidatus Thermokryptus mobilis]CUU03480.1 NADPH-dependent 2,4-dienoyl-CoA reductase, sulfur reductase [Candidatus Thermokryptus mobilis]